jgi:hypothetical protein
MKTDQVLVGEGWEASWGPQLASQKIVSDEHDVGWEESSDRGKWMKLFREALA